MTEDLTNNFPEFKKNLDRLKKLTQSVDYLGINEVKKSLSGVDLKNRTYDILFKAEAIENNALNDMMSQNIDMMTHPEIVNPIEEAPEPKKPKISEEQARVLTPKLQEITEVDRESYQMTPSMLSPKENYGSQKASKINENVANLMKNTLLNYDKRMKLSDPKKDTDWLEKKVTNFGGMTAVFEFESRAQRDGLPAALDWLANSIDKKQRALTDPFGYLESEGEEFTPEFKTALKEEDYYFTEGFFTSLNDLYKNFLPGIYSAFVEEADENVEIPTILVQSIEDMPKITNPSLGRNILKQSVRSELEDRYGKENSEMWIKHIEKYIDDNYDDIKLEKYRKATTPEDVKKRRDTYLENFKDSEVISNMLRLHGFRGSDIKELTIKDIGEKNLPIFINKFVAELKTNPYYHKDRRNAEIIAARIFGDQFEKYYSPKRVLAYTRGNPHYIRKVVTHVNSIVGDYNDNTPKNWRRIPYVKLTGKPGEIKKEDVDAIYNLFKIDGERLYDYLDENGYDKNDPSYIALKKLKKMNDSGALSYLTDKSRHAAIFLENILTDPRGMTEEEVRNGKNYLREGMSHFSNPMNKKSQLYMKDFLNSPMFVDPELLSELLSRENGNPKSSGAFLKLVHEVLPLITGEYYSGRTDKSREAVAEEDYLNNPFVSRMRKASASPENFMEFSKFVQDAMNDLGLYENHRHLFNIGLFGGDVETFFNNMGEVAAITDDMLNMQSTREKSEFERHFFRSPDQHVDRMAEIKAKNWVSDKPEIGTALRPFVKPIFEKFFPSFRSYRDVKDSGKNVDANILKNTNELIAFMNRAMADTILEDNEYIPFNYFAETDKIEDPELRYGVLEAKYILKKFAPDAYQKVLGTGFSEKGIDLLKFPGQIKQSQIVPEETIAETPAVEIPTAEPEEIVEEQVPVLEPEAPPEEVVEAQEEPENELSQQQKKQNLFTWFMGKRNDYKIVPIQDVEELLKKITDESMQLPAAGWSEESWKDSANVLYPFKLRTSMMEDGLSYLITDDNYDGRLKNMRTIMSIKDDLEGMGYESIDLLNGQVIARNARDPKKARKLNKLRWKTLNSVLNREIPVDFDPDKSNAGSVGGVMIDIIVNAPRPDKKSMKERPVPENVEVEETDEYGEPMEEETKPKKKRKEIKDEDIPIEQRQHIKDINEKVKAGTLKLSKIQSVLEPIGLGKLRKIIESAAKKEGILLPEDGMHIDMNGGSDGIVGMSISRSKGVDTENVPLEFAAKVLESTGYGVKLNQDPSGEKWLQAWKVDPRAELNILPMTAPTEQEIIDAVDETYSSILSTNPDLEGNKELEEHLNGLANAVEKMDPKKIEEEVAYITNNTGVEEGELQNYIEFAMELESHNELAEAISPENTKLIGEEKTPAQDEEPEIEESVYQKGVDRQRKIREAREAEEAAADEGYRRQDISPFDEKRQHRLADYLKRTSRTTPSRLPRGAIVENIDNIDENPTMKKGITLSKIEANRNMIRRYKQNPYLKALLSGKVVYGGRIDRDEKERVKVKDWRDADSNERTLTLLNALIEMSSTAVPNGMTTDKYTQDGLDVWMPRPWLEKAIATYIAPIMKQLPNTTLHDYDRKTINDIDQLPKIMEQKTYKGGGGEKLWSKARNEVVEDHGFTEASANEYRENLGKMSDIIDYVRDLSEESEVDVDTKGNIEVMIAAMIAAIKTGDVTEYQNYRKDLYDTINNVIEPDKIDVSKLPEKLKGEENALYELEEKGIVDLATNRIINDVIDVPEEYTGKDAKLWRRRIKDTDSFTFNGTERFLDYIFSKIDAYADAAAIKINEPKIKLSELDAKNYEKVAKVYIDKVADLFKNRMDNLNTLTEDEEKKKSIQGKLTYGLAQLDELKEAIDDFDIDKANNIKADLLANIKPSEYDFSIVGKPLATMAMMLQRGEENRKTRATSKLNDTVNDVLAKLAKDDVKSEVKSIVDNLIKYTENQTPIDPDNWQKMVLNLYSKLPKEDGLAIMQNVQKLLDIRKIEREKKKGKKKKDKQEKPKNEEGFKPVKSNYLNPEDVQIVKRDLNNAIENILVDDKNLPEAIKADVRDILKQLYIAIDNKDEKLYERLLGEMEQQLSRDVVRRKIIPIAGKLMKHVLEEQSPEPTKVVYDKDVKQKMIGKLQERIRKEYEDKQELERQVKDVQFRGKEKIQVGDQTITEKEKPGTRVKVKDLRRKIKLRDEIIESYVSAIKELQEDLPISDKNIAEQLEELTRNK